MGWLEIDVMYTEYCMDCDDEGTKPLPPKEWYKVFLETA